MNGLGMEFYESNNLNYDKIAQGNNPFSVFRENTKFGYYNLFEMLLAKFYSDLETV